MNNLIDPNGELTFFHKPPTYRNLSHLFVDFVEEFPPYEEIPETLDVFPEIIVHGQLTNHLGLPVAGVLVEMWHPTEWGIFGMEYGPSFAPVDPDAQGWACAVTDENGQYCFKTNKRTHQPGIPTSSINFKITDEIGDVTLTKLYYDENLFDPADPFLMDMEMEERCQYKKGTAPNFGDEKDGVCEFDIVMQTT